MTHHGPRATPHCPVREEPCNLCQLYVSGPQDCGLVWLVMNDPELREEYQARRKANAAERKAREAERQGGASSP